MDTARHSDLTRRRILEAGFGEIHRQGFQAASIANILADTGLTKGALYHHFPSKKELGLAVINEVVRDFVDEHMFRPLCDAADPAAKLLDMMTNKDFLDEDFIRLGCPLNNLMQEMSPVDEDFRGALNAIVNEWQTVMREALQRARQQGRVRADVDCRAAALFIVSAWEGCASVAKNMQSLKTFRGCMSQLHRFVESLLVPSA